MLRGRRINSVASAVETVSAVVGDSSETLERCSALQRCISIKVESNWRQRTDLRAQISASSSVRKIHRQGFAP